MARVFVGMGDAMVFISLLRLVALWFPPGRTAMITQVTGVLGQLGALASAAPLALALHRVGLDPLLRHRRRRRRRPRCRARAGRRARLAVRQTTTARSSRCGPSPGRCGWPGASRAPGSACGRTSRPSSASNVFALLWGFPFLVSGQGLSTGTASALLMLMTVTTVVASPIIGTFVTRWPYSRSTLVLWIVARSCWPGPSCCCGRAGRRCRCWCCSSSSSAVGGPGSMVGFDLARTFNPPTRSAAPPASSTWAGSSPSLSTIALIGLVLDHVAPGGPAHLHHRLVPGRHVGAVPRLGARGGPDPAVPPAHPPGDRRERGRPVRRDAALRGPPRLSVGAGRLRGAATRVSAAPAPIVIVS